MRSGSEGTRATPASSSSSTIPGENVEPGVVGDDVESDVLEIIYEPGSHGNRGTIRWADGDVYEGGIKDGEPHGRGVCRYENGNVYDGEWKDNVPHGTGTYYYEDGSVYEGQFDNGREHGKGTLKWQGGRVRLVLEFNRDKMTDLDAGLRYATKYMSNLRHLQINLQMMAEGDAIKLSPKRLSSIFRDGGLESVSCASSGIFKVGFTGIGNAVWMMLHGLKQLRLEYMRLGDVQIVCDIICQQKNALVVLSLRMLDIDWSKAKSRKSIAMAVSSCKHLVKLDLSGSVLMDSDLKVMLQGLPNLRVLSLQRRTSSSHEFTDNTCGIIARKCPGLQELNLDNHTQLSVRGIRKIFNGCSHLRAFTTTSCKVLSIADVQGLLDVAPQLMWMSLHGNIGISPGRVDEYIERSTVGLEEIIESTDGRTVLWLFAKEFQPVNVSAKSKLEYERQRAALNKIWSLRNDPAVVNEWADMLQNEDHC